MSEADCYTGAIWVRELGPNVAGVLPEGICSSVGTLSHLSLLQHERRKLKEVGLLQQGHLPPECSQEIEMCGMLVIKRRLQSPIQNSRITHE